MSDAIIGTGPEKPVVSGQAKNGDVILSVKDLVVSFRSDEGKTQAVRGVTFDLHKGETLCIVGESGSGKSVSCKAIMGILNPSAIIEGGSIMYEGEDLTKLSEAGFHRIRGNKIGMIFQDPLSSLNPIMRIGKQITEGMMVNKDRLKILFNEIITPEFSAYNSIRSEVQSKRYRKKYDIRADKKEIKKFKESSSLKISYAIKVKKEEDAKKIDADPSLRDQLLKEENEFAKSLKQERKEEIANRTAKAKADHKAAIEAYKDAKAKSKGPLKKAKIALKQAKAEAKVKVAEYKSQVEADYRAKAKAIEAQYPSEGDLNAELSSAKKNLEETKAKFKEQRSAEIQNLRNSHSVSPSQIDKQLGAINAKYDDLEKKAEAELVAPITKKISERKEKLQRNYFDNYVAKIKYTKAYAKERALEVMKEVGIPQAEQRFRQYPFEFSGGMRQRIVIAIALTANPEILICDEPTTALDVTIQAQILELINNLKMSRNLSCIFITHDMGVVAEMADRICVMYAGKIVEYGTAYDIFYNPKHPYTWALLSSIPDLDSKERLESIPGTPPNMNFPPEGDAFALRSKYAMGIDFKKMPPFFKVSKTHYAATWLLDERAPKTEMPKIVARRIETSLKKAGVTYEQLKDKEEKLD